MLRFKDYMNENAAVAKPAINFSLGKKVYDQIEALLADAALRGKAFVAKAKAIKGSDPKAYEAFKANPKNLGLINRMAERVKELVRK